MRLLTLARKYPSYIAQEYASHRALSKKPYEEQHRVLLAHCFSPPENRTYSFAQMGYQTAHILANAEPMQKRWAIENGFQYEPEKWLLDIACAQINSFQPEILFVSDYNIFPAQFLRKLKQDVPAIRLIIGWCGAPFVDEAVFHECDLILSNIPELVARFNQNGHKAYHINHAFDPRVLHYLKPPAEPDIDFSFVGSIFKGNEFHISREKLLIELLDRTPLQIWVQLQRPSLREQVSVKIRQMAFDISHFGRKAGRPYSIFNSLPLIGRVANKEIRPGLKGYVAPPIWYHAQQPLFGLSMFQKLRDSRLTLNTHIDLSASSASNLRLYEATGVGCCLITDWKENLSDLFASETEVVTYRNTEDCIEKVRYLLDHEEERKAIAQAGQNRTLRDHTVSQRVEQIHEIIQNTLPFSQVQFP